MNEYIVNGIFALSGTLVGGLISYFIARNAKEIKSLKSNVNILAKQVISFWNLEKLYTEELSKLISKPSKTIKEEFRAKIQIMDFDRPTMTENEAKRILTKNT